MKEIDEFFEILANAGSNLRKVHAVVRLASKSEALQADCLVAVAAVEVEALVVALEVEALVVAVEVEALVAAVEVEWLVAAVEVETLIAAV